MFTLLELAPLQSVTPVPGVIVAGSHLQDVASTRPHTYIESSASPSKEVCRSRNGFRQCICVSARCGQVVFPQLRSEELDLRGSPPEPAAAETGAKSCGEGGCSEYRSYWFDLGGLALGGNACRVPGLAPTCPFEDGINPAQQKSRKRERKQTKARCLCPCCSCHIKRKTK
jgi:hypothetical protein